jgi:hypothetical protein
MVQMANAGCQIDISVTARMIHAADDLKVNMILTYHRSRFYKKRISARAAYCTVQVISEI